MGLHLLEAVVDVSALFLDLRGRPLAEEEDILDGNPGAVMRPEEADVRLVLRVDSHHLARPERETWKMREKEC